MINYKLLNGGFIFDKDNSLNIKDFQSTEIELLQKEVEEKNKNLFRFKRLKVGKCVDCGELLIVNICTLDKDIRCPECKKLYRLQSKLKKIEEIKINNKLTYPGPYICENCGKEFTEDYRKVLQILEKEPIPRFCSKSCAAKPGSSAVKNSLQSRKNISKSLKSFYKTEEGKILIKNNSKLWEEKRQSKIFYCKECGRPYNQSDIEAMGLKHSLYCSEECRKKHIGGVRENSGKSKSGWYKGIYCNSTYELAWVMYMMDNNLPFKRSKVQIPYTFKGKQHTYYPDFELSDGSLIEIKGYYSETVEIKRQAAIDQGYKIKVLYLEDLRPYIQFLIKEHDLKLNPNSKLEDLRALIKFYDKSKNIYQYECIICGEDYKTERNSEGKIKLCSRSCCGKYQSSINRFSNKDKDFYEYVRSKKEEFIKLNEENPDLLWYDYLEELEKEYFNKNILQ